MGIFSDIGDFIEDTTILGAFGSDGGGGGQSATNQMIQKQIEQSQKRLKEKKRHLYSTELQTVHGQGAVNWNPTATTRGMFD